MINRQFENLAIWQFENGEKKPTQTYQGISISFFCFLNFAFCIRLAFDYI